MDKASLNRLEATLADPIVKVISVDVFDTLLLRTTKPEYHRFADMARRSVRALRGTVLNKFTVEQILVARLTAAEIAYRTAKRNQGLREPKHHNILDLMVEILGLASEHLPLLHKIEIDYERSVLYPNHRLITLLQAAHHAGKKIIIISDMYLSGADIRNLIETCAPKCPLDEVYSSADVGLSKRYEKIFPYIAGQIRHPLVDFVHIGDNVVADVEVPRRLGMRAIHTPRPHLWRTIHAFRQKRFMAKLKRKGISG